MVSGEHESHRARRRSPGVGGNFGSSVPGGAGRGWSAGSSVVSGWTSRTTRHAPFPAFGVPLRSVRATVKTPLASARKNSLAASSRASTLTKPSLNERDAERVSPPSSVTSTESA